MIQREETGAIRKNWAHQLRIALVYPNSYRVGMSNLGFQHVYHALNLSSAYLAERFFLETARVSEAKAPARLLSVESSRPLRDFHVVAFSLPFENDYLNVPHILRLGAIAPLAKDRSSSDPLIMAGGVSVSMNPEPLANFMDLFVIGEIGNVDQQGSIFATLAELITRRRAESDRDFIRERLRDCPGVYIPSAYSFSRATSGILDSVDVAQGYPSSVVALKSDWDSDMVPQTVITSRDAEFSDTVLVEVNRGCSRRCRFCAAGWIHGPVRYRGLDRVRPVLERARELGLRLGLVGSDLAGHPELEKMVDLILSGGSTFSLSSIRPEGLSDFMIDCLAATGQKTATLAPEVAGMRLKEVIGKKIPPALFHSIIERLLNKGVINIRLYFMIGLPTETDDDIHQIVEFVMECRETFVSASRKNKRIGVMSVQVNPFIPKPWTPFQWAGVIRKDILESRIGILKKGLGKVSNMSLRIEYGRDFFIQALLSRCDRNLGQALLDVDPQRKWSAQTLEKAGINLDAQIYREREEDEIFPWDVVDHGISKQVLWKIYKNAKEITC